MNTFIFHLEKKDDFMKYPRATINSMGSPYDYGSIMHFGKHEGAKSSWQITIKPRKPGVSIGQRSTISTQDAIQINKMYNNCKKR